MPFSSINLAINRGFGMNDPNQPQLQPALTGDPTENFTTLPGSSPGQELITGGLNEFNAEQRRVQETENAVIGESNQRGLGEAVSEAGSDADRFSGSVEGAISRRQRGLGLNLTDREKRSQGRRLGLTRSIRRASATRGVRSAFQQNAQNANRAGSLIEDTAFGIGASTSVQLANAAGQNAIRLENERQANKSQRTGLFGTVIGIGAALLSSEHVKDHKRPEKNLLKRLKDVRVEKWRYIGEDTDHVGPYAEEFNDAFGVGQEDHGKISVIDALGISLGAIKELNERVESLNG